MGFTFKKILVAVDFSETSRRALATAVDLATALGATLRVLHVVDPRGVTLGFGEGATFPDAASLVKRLHEVAERELPRFIENLDIPEGLSVETSIVGGIPATEIVSAAEADDIDAVVCGTHGRSGFSRLFFGSVASKVVRLAHIPVMTVGPVPEIHNEEQPGKPGTGG